jgi:ATPase subunit of ABC transporter with duplicated ATPase domains
VSGLQKAFGDRILIDDLDFEIPRGSVVGVVGANGAGKSTLVKMLSGAEAPTKGEVRVGGTVQLATVDQSRDRLDALADKTIFDAIAGGRETLDLGGRDVNARAYVGAFGFRSREQSKKVGALSGGERNRACLADILKEGANVIVLDEPTNDLDVGTLRALEEAILGFAGTVLAVSHDRYFLDRVATHIIAFEGDGNVVFYNGNWAEYEADRTARMGDEVSSFKYRKLVEA